MGTHQSLSYSVPFYAPSWGRRELLATLRCLITGRVVRGPDRQYLAHQVGEFLELPYVLLVNRGRCAVELAVRALEIGETDEVVLPSFLCESVLQSVRKTGARPMLADLGDGFHVDPGSIRAKLTARTKCVIVPHLFGNTAPIDAIEKDLEGTRVALIDDAAQAFGARLGIRRAGTFGACGVISTGLGKPLEGTAGGALVTSNRALFERALTHLKGEETPVVVLRRALAGWVWHRMRRYTLPLKARSDQMFSTDQTSRIRPRAMSNLDAAIAIQQLQSLQQSVELRRNRAAELFAVLGDAGEYRVSDLSASSLILTAALLLPANGPKTKEVIAALWRLGIEAREGYEPLHHKLGLPPEEFPNTERIRERLVLIPLTRPLDGRQRTALARIIHEPRAARWNGGGRSA